MPVLPRLNDYDEIYRQFRWQVPARYNIGVDVCDRWARQEPDRLAILHIHPDDSSVKLQRRTTMEPKQPSLFTRLGAGRGPAQAQKTLLTGLKADHDALREDRDEWRWRAERLLANRERQFGRWGSGG